jgi:hypothetical protein
MCSPTCKTVPPALSKKPSADALQYGCSKQPRREHRGFPFVSCVFAILQGFYEYRRSGSNRHGAFAPPDFESENLRLGTSYHILVCGLSKPKPGVREAGSPYASGRVLPSIAAILLPRATGVSHPIIVADVTRACAYGCHTSYALFGGGQSEETSLRIPRIL